MRHAEAVIRRAVLTDEVDTEAADAMALPAAVEVDAPARLHLGFIDLNGGLGRRFGSVGLAIDGLGVRLRARRRALTSEPRIDGPSAERVASAIVRLRPLLRPLVRPSVDGLDGFEIDVVDAIPDHVGLGSGTQAALATGTALSTLFGLDLSARRLASLLERGARSGIGLGAFEQGGFVVDGGRIDGDHGDDGAPPPVVSRLEFPDAWRIVLIFDRAGRGIHGQQEIDAFRALPAFPEALAAALARRVMMQMLPGLAERRLDEFGAAVAELQDRVGDHFAPAQGGRFASEAVARALALARSAGVAASGQSSWGPTGFAIVDGDAAARALVERLGAALPADVPERLQLRIVRGRNHGATIAC